MSPATIILLGDGKEIDLSLEILSLCITKEINRLPFAQLMLLDGHLEQQTFNISDSPVFEPGKAIEIKLRYERDPDSEKTVFKGWVLSQSVSADSHGSLLTVQLKDEAVKMTGQRKSAVYNDKTDADIIADIVTANGLEKGAFATTEVQHQELVQYYCTDWDFIVSRAEHSGKLLVVDDGEVSLAGAEVSGAAQFTFEVGNDDIFDFEIEANGSGQFSDIESIAWDVKNQRIAKAVKAARFALSQGNLDAGTLAKRFGNDLKTLSSPVPLPQKELQAWSDGAMVKSRLSMIRGRLTVPGDGNLKLMDVIEVGGIGNRFNGKTLVTGLRHRVGEQGWQTDIQFGISPKPFAENRDLIDVPAAGLLPAVNGLQVGVIDAFEADPEKEYRVRVILPGIDEKKGALWARLATPDGGKDRGFFFRPEKGDEVIVGFFNDDPRQPVVLGAMYGSKNSPPEDVRALEQENLYKAIVTKQGAKIVFVDDKKPQLFIETPASNKIILDDNAERIQLIDQHNNEITLSENGISIKSAKDIVLDAAGNVTIKGAKIDIE